MNNLLNILVIGSTYPRTPEDSQVPWLRETVNRLAARGHHVEVLASAYRGSKDHVIDDIPVHRYRYGPARWETLTHDEGAPNKKRGVMGNLLALLYILSGTWRAMVLARRLHIDVLHVHWPFPHGIMGLAAGWLTGAKVVANCHGAELAMGRRSRWIATALRWALRASDGVLCNSSHTQEEIRRLADVEAVIMPYGSTVSFPPVNEVISAPTAQKPARLLFCGRLIERKGIDILLRALPAIHHEHPVHLTITGEGDKKAEWQQLARELGLENIVEFAGFVSNEELGRLYRECQVYIHPAVIDSRGDTEGLGVVLIEALMHAKPVVASAVGGIPDVIRHGTSGVLVPERDIEGLALAVLTLLENPVAASQLGLLGRKFAEWHFDWDRIIENLDRYYHQVGQRNRETNPSSLPESPRHA